MTRVKNAEDKRQNAESLRDVGAARFPRQNGQGSPTSTIAFAMTVFIFFRAPSAFACPLCKEAIAKMGQIWISIGFNLSIYFMIAVPFLIVAIFGTVLYFKYRSHERK